MMHDKTNWWGGEGRQSAGNREISLARQEEYRSMVVGTRDGLTQSCSSYAMMRLFAIEALAIQWIGRPLPLYNKIGQRLHSGLQFQWIHRTQMRIILHGWLRLLIQTNNDNWFPCCRPGHISHSFSHKAMKPSTTLLWSFDFMFMQSNQEIEQSMWRKQGVNEHNLQRCFVSSRACIFDEKVIIKQKYSWSIFVKKEETA